MSGEETVRDGLAAMQALDLVCALRACDPGGMQAVFAGIADVRQLQLVACALAGLVAHAADESGASDEGLRTWAGARLA